MKLYITSTSPYARMARIVVLEKGLSDRVEVVPAETRTPGSPYYAINPSGRVPYLVLPAQDGVGECDGIEGSALICRVLDHLDGAPSLEAADPQPAAPAARLEARAHSTLDGLAVWARELRRPENERSPGIIEHERARSQRLTAHWERWIEDPLMQLPFNHPQLALIVTLEMDARLKEFAWRADHPRLRAWAEGLGARDAVAATRPAP